MAFLMDKQTFTDLEIFGAKGEKNTIFNFFDREAMSHGGRKELLDMFNSPLSEKNEIQERQELISNVCKGSLSFPIDKYVFEFIEIYLDQHDKPAKVSRIDAWRKALKYKIKPNSEYYIIHRGIKYVIELLQELYSFATENSVQNHPPLLKKQFDYFAESIRTSELQLAIGINAEKKISIMNQERFDYIFRNCEYELLKNILRKVYQIDAFQAVAAAKVELGLVFPEIIECKTIEIKGLYHQFVKNAVTNDIKINEDGNLFFLSGANMSGKSTFLKAFGVATYLAHIGFPVPAVSMRTGVFNGIFSTINIADNLNKGYSHFYAEVLRVKNVAEEINRTKNLVVIFDELFRGTNVKDAYEASLAIIAAFAKVKGSVFLISTHIVEIAEQLRRENNIRFGYFHTEIKGKTFVNSYHLLEGVTEERLGMLIVEKEQIIETINSASEICTQTPSSEEFVYNL
jgi:DNA mismatch repair ATPase MutS